MLGGRNLPVLLIFGTTIATMVGTGSSMGAVGYAYQNGWAGTLYGLGGAVGILLLAWIYAPIRAHRFMTMSEEIAYYVGANTTVKNLVAILTFAASIGWLGAHIIGGGIYLAWVTDINPNLSKLSVSLGFAIYVIIGGYLAVVWTDTIQAIILFLGFMLMVVMSVHYIGSWSMLLAAQPAENTTLFALGKVGIIPAVSLSAAIMVGILATPAYRQRIYSAKNVSTARKSFVLSGGAYLFFSFIPAIAGMAAYAMNSDLKEPSYAFPYLALQVLPIWAGTIVLIAGLSATMSSASSDAIAAVSILLRDLYKLLTGQMPDKTKMIYLSRIGLVLVIGIALLFALTSNDIIGYITKMIATVMSGLCACALLGRFWQGFTWQGAICALAAGSSTSILVIYQDDWLSYWGNPILPAITMALIAGFVISLLTPKSSVSRDEALTILAAERAQIEES